MYPPSIVKKYANNHFVTMAQNTKQYLIANNTCIIYLTIQSCHLKILTLLNSMYQCILFISFILYVCVLFFFILCDFAQNIETSLFLSIVRFRAKQKLIDLYRFKKKQNLIGVCTNLWHH